ncbi:hypothetical protein [Emticicia sp. C21]|uniref:hypothetical protein n=1 Tax=Emticicia sp. C21 TaxID=2302915 RepID=UPI000E960861|nr:hypothetical protein [Emticicia sp. C21]RFS17097.1 hypothetical protein D0T08_10510 [Emticicia sp. C21]
MIKKLSVLLVLSCVLLYFCFNPLVILPERGYDQIETKPMHKGDSLNILEGFNFETGNWKMYLVIAESDKPGLSIDMPDGKIFETTDKELLKEMQRNFYLSYQKSDVSTVESELILIRDNKFVLRANIQMDNNLQGVQHQSFGWLKAIRKNQLSMYFKKFSRVYIPVIFL